MYDFGSLSREDLDPRSCAAAGPLEAYGPTMIQFPSRRLKPNNTRSTITVMKILVSGGGIAGNALVYWLSKLGHDVPVVEWFPSLRDNGLQIDLRGNGIEVIKRMCLEQAIRSKSVPEQGLQQIDNSDRCWANFPVNKFGKGLQSFTTEFGIMRGDLCQLLHNITKDRARFVFGTSIKSFEEKDSPVEVWFTDGTTDRFDLLVGADSLRSPFAEIFEGAGWQTEEILKALMEDNDFYCERLGLVKLDCWSSGRVTLVGDAAYCPSPLSGMGTSSVFVGAYILAGEIGEHCPNRDDTNQERDNKDGLAAALKAYEQKFRPFMDQPCPPILSPSSSFLAETAVHWQVDSSGERQAVGSSPSMRTCDGIRGSSV
ncbi:hypothetical protein B7463_g1361, partial [Scytalidium lignicola]